MPPCAWLSRGFEAWGQEEAPVSGQSQQPPRVLSWACWVTCRTNLRGPSLRASSVSRKTCKGRVGGSSQYLGGQPDLEEGGACHHPLNYSEQHHEWDASGVKSEVASQKRGKFQFEIQNVARWESANCPLLSLQPALCAFMGTRHRGPSPPTPHVSLGPDVPLRPCVSSASANRERPHLLCSCRALPPCLSPNTRR